MLTSAIIILTSCDALWNYNRPRSPHHPVCDRHRLCLSSGQLPRFFISANMTRMRAREIDRERVMCPSYVLINHATRDPSVRDVTPFFLVPAFPTLFPVWICGIYSSGFRKLVPPRDTSGKGRAGQGRKGRYKIHHIDRWTPDAIWQEVYRRRINSNSLAFICFLWRSPDREWKLSFCFSLNFLYEIPVSSVIAKWHLGLIQASVPVGTPMCSKRLFVANVNANQWRAN